MCSQRMASIWSSPPGEKTACTKWRRAWKRDARPPRARHRMRSVTEGRRGTALSTKSRPAALTIDALVNNAGYGVPGTYLASAWERHAAMLNLMVMAVSELTYRLLPGMIERRYGRIINVASLAGLVPTPAGHTLYAATKAFAIKFSEALAHEGRPHGVHVTAVCPGFTLSEFHDVTGTRAQVSKLPAWMWMDASTVARQGFDAVMERHARLHQRARQSCDRGVRTSPSAAGCDVGRSAAREVLSENLTYEERYCRASRSTSAESVSPSSVKAEASGDHASL